MPRLPRPCANFCGTLLGNTIYVAGGIETPASTTALRTFWSLDLEAEATLLYHPSNRTLAIHASKRIEGMTSAD